MFTSQFMRPEIWSFDGEWVPNHKAGQILHNFKGDEASVIKQMYEQYGATEEDPQPYLKEILCRLVAFAAVKRTQRTKRELSLSLWSVVLKNEEEEKDFLFKFATDASRLKPLMVGHNHKRSDMKILVQRMMMLGVKVPGFMVENPRPYEIDNFMNPKGGSLFDTQEKLNFLDYRNGPSLNEACTLAGIPGKLGTSGCDVTDLWLAGKYDEIRDYVECDALSSHLLYLKMLNTACLLKDDEYLMEQSRLRDHLMNNLKDSFVEFLNTWKEYQDFWGLPFASHLEKV